MQPSPGFKREKSIAGKWRCVIRRANDINFQTTWLTHTHTTWHVALEIIRGRIRREQKPESIHISWGARRTPLVIAPLHRRRHFGHHPEHVCVRARARAICQVSCPGLARRDVLDDVIKRRRADYLGWRSTTTERMYPPTGYVGVLCVWCVCVRSRARERAVDERVVNSADLLARFIQYRGSNDGFSLTYGWSTAGMVRFLIFAYAVYAFFGDSVMGFGRKLSGRLSRCQVFLSVW